MNLEVQMDEHNALGTESDTRHEMMSAQKT